MIEKFLFITAILVIAGFISWITHRYYKYYQEEKKEATREAMIVNNDVMSFEEALKFIADQLPKPMLKGVSVDKKIRKANARVRTIQARQYWRKTNLRTADYKRTARRIRIFPRGQNNRTLRGK